MSRRKRRDRLRLPGRKRPVYATTPSRKPSMNGSSACAILTCWISGAGLDTGLSLTRGNSEVLTYALAGKAVRTTERDKITVYSNAIYAKSKANGVTSTTAHAIVGGIRGDLNVSKKWFVFGFTDFEYDAFEHLDLRNVLGGGLGYHVVATEKTKFHPVGGASFEQEYYSPNPPTVLTSLTRKVAEAVAGEELDTKLNRLMTLSDLFAPYTT